VVGLPIFVLEVYFYAFLTALGRLNTANKAIVIGKTLAWGGVLIIARLKGHLSSSEVLASLVAGQLAIVFGYTVCLISEFNNRGIRLAFDQQSFLRMVKNQFNFTRVLLVVLFLAVSTC